MSDTFDTILVVIAGAATLCALITAYSFHRHVKRMIAEDERLGDGGQSKRPPSPHRNGTAVKPSSDATQTPPDA